jgi:hypothetical protein
MGDAPVAVEMVGATGQAVGRSPGLRVRFRVRDVFVPEPGRVREQIGGDVELVGVLVALSDSGDRPSEFGIVRMGDGVNVVVPVTALTELHDA